MIFKAVLAVVLAGLSFGFPASASASVTSLTIHSMTVDYYLGRDSAGNATLRTVESFNVEFPDFDVNHGIERAIPLKYGEARLDLKVVSVTDGQGGSLNYSRNDSGGFAVLRIGDADRYVHGTQTYRIEYTQRNVVASFADTNSDEFYWDVNGTGWSEAFENVTARIHLQDGIESDLTGSSACYWGYEGSTSTCAIVRDGDTFMVSAEQIDAYQTVTFAIGFKKSTFVDPPLLKNAWPFAILPYILMGLTGLAFLIALFLRIFVWQDWRSNRTIIAQYSPPDGMYPLLAAQLLNRIERGLPAQIVGFATEKVLRIRELDQKQRKRRYQLELLNSGMDVPIKEMSTLKALFGSLKEGKILTLDSKDTTLGDRISARIANLPGEIRSNGWEYTPKSKWPKYLRWFTFLVAVAAIVLWFFMVNFDLDLGRVWAAGWLCALGWIVVAVVSTIPSLLNDEGREVRDHLKGVRDYLKLAETDRIKMLQAPDTAERIDVTDKSAVLKLYEKLLPYAIIFGIEDKWMTALGTYYGTTQTPDWFAGASQLSSIGNFAGSIRATSFATTPPVSSSRGSSWSSSGGSSFSGGSSGGGFSGGGGGGGGGGGW